MGYFHRKNNVDKDDIIIREETQEEYHIVEDIVLRAFWNIQQIWGGYCMKNMDL